jgi:hypothetical protein
METWELARQERRRKAIFQIKSVFYAIIFGILLAIWLGLDSVELGKGLAISPLYWRLE